MPAARGVRGHACLLTSTAPYKDGWSESDTHHISAQEMMGIASLHPSYTPLLRALAVAIKPLPGLAAEMAGGDHFLQQRRGAVFRVVEALVEDFHHRQHRIQTDHVGERERADRVMAPKL